METPILLPTRLLPSKRDFIRLGFAFGSEVDADGNQMIISVPPKGWVVGYSAYGNPETILDQDGRKRVRIHIRVPDTVFSARDSGVAELETRYKLGLQDWGPHGSLRFGILDQVTGGLISEIGVVGRVDGKLDWEHHKRLRALGENEIARLLPRHRDPLAYWPGDPETDESDEAFPAAWHELPYRKVEP